MFYSQSNINFGCWVALPTQSV